MKLNRVFIYIALFNCMLAIIGTVKVTTTSTTSTSTSTQTKTSTRMRIQSAEKLLSEIKQFNLKYDPLKYNGSKDKVVEEAKGLDMKYNELVNIFLEKKSESKRYVKFCIYF